MNDPSTEPVVTIGRQYGAGGLAVGRLVAERLGVPFYDRELLALAAEKSGLCEALFERHDEKPAEPAFLSAWAVPWHAAASQPIGQQVFFAQFEAIRAAAAKGGCVIVGRCADFVLDGRPNVLRVFLRAPLEKRIARIVERDGVDEAAARKRLRVAEKNRAAYYDYFTDRKWGAAETYDLCLNTARFPSDEAVADLVAAAARSAFG
ncbi:MAG: cytidylate kinase-like family protein [Kiritimatiellae bacterium]|nr:cytidylate kinase-like family protein [Kiritimatiellia bacterium]